MVEGHTYTYAKYDTFFKDYLPKKNEAWLRNYKQLKKDGMKQLYYVTTEGLFGYDNEGTVDGIHYTDLGYRYYAQKLEKVLKKFVK
jgi:lysophospholipase L1-like esterase